MNRQVSRTVIFLVLALAAVFMGGCGGAAGDDSISIRFDVRETGNMAGVEGVRVTLYAASDSSGTEPYVISRQAMTDSRGRYTFSDLPSHRFYHANFFKDNYTFDSVSPGQSNWVSGNPAPPDTPVGLWAEPGNSYVVTVNLATSASPSSGSLRGYVRNRYTSEPITTAVVTSQWTNSGGLDEQKSDTTDKPSSPGLYQLNGVPSGGAVTLSVRAAGYDAYTEAISIPANQTLTVDVVLDPQTGTIDGFLVAREGETLSGTFIVGAYRNGSDLMATTSVSPNNAASQNFNLPNVPAIPEGSTSSYTVKVVSDSASMFSPAGGISNIVVRRGQSVNVSPITMEMYKGNVEVIVYRINSLTAGETHATVQNYATVGSASVTGVSTTYRYTGESPDHFYHYVLENVPVGNRQVQVMFPRTNVAPLNVTVVKDQTIKVTVNGTAT